MNQNLKAYLILSAVFLLLFGIAELLYHKARVKAEYTRKLVHFGTGIITLSFPLVFDSHWWVLLICASFLGILFLSLKYNFLQSINAIDRFSSGSVLYPVVVYVCFWYWQHYATACSGTGLNSFYLPILVLALCDPVAALVGKRFPWKPYRVFKEQKTLSGSLAFFACSCLLFLIFDGHSHLIAILLISLTAAAVEAFSTKGTDNLTIPFSVLVMMKLAAPHMI